MTSTVLDAALCLLLVSAGTVTLATTTPPQPSDGSRADAAAETLAASTATVNYTLSSGARRASDRRGSRSEPDGRAVDRTAQGTLARLLADATVGNVTVGERRLSRASDDFRRETERAVAAAVGTNGMQVVAVWRPYDGADVRARVTVGPRPPPRTDVHAASFTVASGFPTARSEARNASDGGFRAVARIAAERTVSGLFPPERLRDAVGGDDPDAALARYRYRRGGDLLDVDAEVDVARGRTEAANERLTAALTRHFERDLRREHDSPRAAAQAVRVGRVRVTVRTWSG